MDWTVRRGDEPRRVRDRGARDAVVDGRGQRRKAKTVIHEGFSNPPYQPILPPGTRKLATDAGLLPEGSAEACVMAGGEYLGVYGAVEIDSAIFDNGIIVGPDRCGVVKHLRDRHSAIEALLLLIDEGLARGRTLDDIITDVSVNVGEARARAWREVLVSNIRRNRSFLDFLRKRRTLPENSPLTREAATGT